MWMGFQGNSAEELCVPLHLSLCRRGEEGTTRICLYSVLLRRKYLLDDSREYKQSNLAVTGIRAWLLSCVKERPGQVILSSKPPMAEPGVNFVECKVLDDFLQTHCIFAPIFPFKVNLSFEIHKYFIHAQAWFLIYNLPHTSTLQVTGCKWSVSGSACEVCCLGVSVQPPACQVSPHSRCSFH